MRRHVAGPEERALAQRVLEAERAAAPGVVAGAAKSSGPTVCRTRMRSRRSGTPAQRGDLVDRGVGGPLHGLGPLRRRRRPGRWRRRRARARGRRGSRSPRGATRRVGLRRLADVDRRRVRDAGVRRRRCRRSCWSQSWVKNSEWWASCGQAPCDAEHGEHRARARASARCHAGSRVRLQRGRQQRGLQVVQVGGADDDVGLEPVRRSPPAVRCARRRSRGGRPPAAPPR